ncbi:MAG: glycosyltransferase family 2 protein [Cytophagales bacterium]|nr:glycosyltransferase family 2 protein [Cytophagales bacterium]
MSVAIVILNFNGRGFLEKFLPDVILNTPEGKIYVADNGSTDDSVKLVEEKFPAVTIIQWANNLGYAGGYNFALKQIEAEYFVLMNSDIKPQKDWLKPLLSFFELYPTCAAVQPYILDFKQPEYFEYAGAAGGYWDQLGYPFSRGRIFDQLEKNENQYPTSFVHWASGACLMVKSELFWKVGGLDDYFFAHMEEIDLCWRLQRAGYQIAAVAESQVLHVGGGTLAQGTPFKTYLNFRNNLILLYKNVDPAHKFTTIFKRMLLDGIAGLRFLTNRQWMQFLAVVHAHFHFYKYLIFHKNKQNLPESLQKNYIESYPGNIVVDYFFRKIKKFSDLKF